MTQFTTNAQKFADLFNAKVLGAYRQITIGDVRDMTTCSLIERCGYYIHLDIDTIRSVLQYEQLRYNCQKRDEIKDDDGVIHCRGCGVELAKPEDKRGRSREYYHDCESSRITMRGRE